MKRTGLTTRHWLATLALTTSIWAAPALAQWQNTPSQDMPQPRQDTMQPGMPPQGTPAQPVTRQDQDDLNRRQLSEFDQFLDRHPEIAEQLRRDPSLIRNQQFVANHPELQQFLQNHPEIQRDLDQHPNAVMHQEERFDRRDDGRAGNGIPQGELEAMRQFLNTHPEIAEQLQKNPRLIDNKNFVDDHSDLKQFLAEHPQLRGEFDQHPYAFMRGEDRDDRASRMQLTDLDQFLDKHPEIAQQLQKDPSLINSRAFVQDHPALQQFLANHPQLTAELQENPNAIMRQEDRYEQHENGNQGYGRHTGDNDVTRGELASFHEFLENHNNIASELEKNPSLANNSEYLQNHTALQSYLQANPQVSEELHENPQSFIKSSEAFDATAQGGMKTMPKPMTADPMKKQ
jgi:hypothetical protein